jgi:hypothetical protein
MMTMLSKALGIESAGARSYDLLERQTRAATVCARVFSELVHDRTSTEEAVALLAGATEEAGAAKRELEELLGHTLSTPIDREDLHGLAAGFGRAFVHTYRSADARRRRVPAAASKSIRSVSDTLVVSTERMTASVATLRGGAFDKLLDVGRELRTCAAKARALLTDGMSDMIVGPATDSVDTVELVREAALYDELRTAFTAYHGVAVQLIHLSVKNS